MDKDVAESYRRSVEDLIAVQNAEFVDLEIDGSEGVCPIINEPCGFVSSCDDVMNLVLGLSKSVSCPRVVAFLKAGKK